MSKLHAARAESAKRRFRWRDAINAAIEKIAKAISGEPDLAPRKVKLTNASKMTDRDVFIAQLVDGGDRHAVFNQGAAGGEIVKVLNLDDPQLNAFLGGDGFGGTSIDQRVRNCDECVHVKRENGAIEHVPARLLWPCEAPDESGGK